MIQGLIDVCINILQWIIGLFPKVTFFSSISESVAGIYDYLYNASAIIPVSDFFICIGLISGFYVTLFAVKVINWVVHRIPFIN
ncbi:hypothetical protein [Streptococcus ovuberis]|uniref:Uncharacterized protein n=1 Tax=Streptococcus ovuberis TaxID=1936207 RepID=A0A7X6S1M6_9STRE|nr:hypothetical protein [Streptococcus ovuberis]NKZ21423.1 hypothetical protein [Streptococcus ovuberis]